MHRLLYLFIGFSYISEGRTYVLLQVRRQDDNHTNVDALIHKVVSSEKIDKITKKLSRKQFTQNEYPDIKNNLDTVVVAIDTGAKKLDNSRSKTPDLLDKIIKTITGFVGGQAAFRSHDFKPEIVHFRSGKPSLMFEINSEAIIKSLKDLLTSRAVVNYLDKFTKKAATVYRSLNKETSKD